MAYSDNLATAQRLIDAKGRSVILQVLSSVAADANKPWKPGAGGVPTVQTSYGVKGVFVPHTGLESLGIDATDVELLKRSEQVLLVAGNVVDLSACHQIEDSGTLWRIVWVKTLKPGDLRILHAFGVAR
jgi:hypothetical protein